MLGGGKAGDNVQNTSASVEEACKQNCIMALVAVLFTCTCLRKDNMFHAFPSACLLLFQSQCLAMLLQVMMLCCAVQCIACYA
jgi:hypothetical protein